MPLHLKTGDGDLRLITEPSLPMMQYIMQPYYGTYLGILDYINKVNVIGMGRDLVVRDLVIM